MTHNPIIELRLFINVKEYHHFHFSRGKGYFRKESKFYRVKRRNTEQSLIGKQLTKLDVEVEGNYSCIVDHLWLAGRGQTSSFGAFSTGSAVEC